MNNPFDISTKIVEALDPSMDEKIEKEKLDEKDEKSGKFYWDYCYHCHTSFQARSWNEPPSCPFCHYSRVD